MQIKSFNPSHFITNEKLNPELEIFDGIKNYIYGEFTITKQLFERVYVFCCLINIEITLDGLNIYLHCNPDFFVIGFTTTS